MEMNLNDRIKNDICNRENLPKRIFVLNQVPNIEEVFSKLQGLQFQVVNNIEILKASSSNALFILNEFETPVFDEIRKRTNRENRILGYVAVLDLALNNEPISARKNDVFNLSMSGMVFHLSLKPNKDLAAKILKLIRYMGGSVLADYNMKTTHIIGNSTLRPCYAYAMAFSIPCMTTEWVFASWEQRHQPHFRANNDEMIMKYKMKPFLGLYISFLGFHSYDNHVAKLNDNQGSIIDIEDSKCTHLVVNFGKNCTLTYDIIKRIKDKKIHVVTHDWFWESVIRGVKIPETEFPFELERINIISNPDDNLLQSKSNFLTTANSKNDNFDDQCDLEDDFDFSILSVNDSLVEESTAQFIRKSRNSSIIDFSFGSISDYFNPCFIEFVQTEERYIEVLDLILEIRNDLASLNNCGIQESMNSTEIKIVFRNLDSITSLHKRILKDIKKDSESAAVSKTPFSLPNILILYNDDMKRLYPIYSAGIDESQVVLDNACKIKPKLRDVLKRWQEKIESGRQHLRELLIRPIQRVGSMCLLLKEIIRTSSAGDSILKQMRDALKSLENVMEKMNSNKEHIGDLIILFKIYNSIVDFPPHLLSSQRYFILKFMVENLIRIPSDAEVYCFFIFCDYFVICKVRKKVKSLVLAGKNENKYFKASGGKPFKYLTAIPIKDVKNIIDVKDNKEVKFSFGFNYFKNGDKTNECAYYFRCINSEISKRIALQKMSSCLAMHDTSLVSSQYVTQILPDQFVLKSLIKKPEIYKFIHNPI